MKVLYVIPGIGTGGGAERSLLDLAPGLRANGVDLQILYLHERPTSAQAQFAAAGVPTRRVEARTWPGRLRAVRRAIRLERPDVVHTTLWEADLLGRLAAVGLPPRVLTSLVSTPYAPARRRDPAWSTWRMGLVRRLDAATLRLRNDHVHANSRAVREAAVRDLGVDAADITVVPRGRDPERFVPADADRRARARAALAVPADAPVLVTVARQEATKDHATLLAALPAVVDRHPALQLLLVGSAGAATPAIEAQVAAAHLDGHVRSLGFRSDVDTVLAAADAFVFPSLLEGLPGALIEAMAAEVPIVAAAIEPVRELVDDASALLVPPGDAAALTAALLEVLGDPAAAATRAAVARDRFLRHFTLDRALEGMLALYRRVASEEELMAS